MRQEVAVTQGPGLVAYPLRSRAKHDGLEANAARKCTHPVVPAAWSQDLFAAKTNPQMTNFPLHTRINREKQCLCLGRAVELEESLISVETRGSLEHQGWDVGQGRP